ncbi:MAG: hypothetical protein MK135_09500 [Polyangiaceae bacterium]|nr:hypothetical protein [Polyangiaceae bacterium]
MLVPDKKLSWLNLVFALKGSALARIRYRLLAVLLLSFVLTGIQYYHIWDPVIPLSSLSLVGLVLGIFLGFRNNTSYDRFWEGRKLWGSLVNTSRSITREILFFLPDEGATGASPRQREMVHLIIAYVHSLRLHLRGQLTPDALADWLTQEQQDKLQNQSNAPNALLLDLARRINLAYNEGLMGENRLIALEERMVDLSNIQGGCERIRNTPIPISYSILIHRIVALYVFALPLSLVPTLQFATPLAVLVVAYTILGLDALGEELEDPFGEEPNDLPLLSLSTMIECNLRDALGEERPQASQPVNGILN